MHWSLSPAQGVGRLAAQPQQAGGDGGQGEDHVRLGDVALAVLLHRHVHHLLVTTLPRLQAPAEAPGDVIREGEGNHLDKGANVNTSLLIDASPGIQRGPDLSNGKQYYRQQSASTLGAGITKQKNELFSLIIRMFANILTCHVSAVITWIQEVTGSPPPSSSSEQ